MTNDVAIKRKLIYQGITFVIWGIFLAYFTSVFTILPQTLVLYSTVILPVFILIAICKIVRTVLYIHATYNSDIEFESYSHTKSALPKKHKFFSEMILFVIFIISISLMAWSGYSTLFMEKVIETDFKSFTFAEYSNFDVDSSAKEIGTSHYISTYPSEIYRCGEKYLLSGKTNLDGEQFEDGYANISCDLMKDCPRWTIKKMYNEGIKDLNNSDFLENKESALYEIETEGVTGYYELTNNNSYINIVAMSGNDFINLRIGSNGDQDAMKVDYQKVLEFAIEWLEKY